MTTKLDEAVAILKTLPDDEQARAADALFAFALEKSSYTLSDEDLAGIDHAIAQADRGEYASGREIEKVFGRSL